MKVLLIVLSLVSGMSFSQASGPETSDTPETLYFEFSNILLATSAEMAALSEDCGHQFRNLKKTAVGSGVARYDFDMKQYGLGRLGGTLYKNCQVQIVVDWSRTWTDGAVGYTVTHQVLPL